MPNTIEATLKGATGPAFVERNGSRFDLKEGDPIYESDLIITGPETTIDIAYRDGTKSRIGPDSEMKLVDFEYGPDVEPSFLVNLTQGAMRTVSGEIVKLNPESFEVLTPRATVGIRGTEFFTQVSDGNETHAVLFIEEGHIMAVTGENGSAVVFDTPLQVTTFKEGMPANLQIQQYSLDEIETLINDLSPVLANALPKDLASQGAWTSLEEATQAAKDRADANNNKKTREAEDDADKSASTEEANADDAAVAASLETETEKSSETASTNTTQIAPVHVAIVFDDVNSLEAVLVALKGTNIVVEAVIKAEEPVEVTPNPSLDVLPELDSNDNLTAESKPDITNPDNGLSPETPGGGTEGGEGSGGSGGEGSGGEGSGGEGSGGEGSGGEGSGGEGSGGSGDNKVDVLNNGDKLEGTDKADKFNVTTMEGGEIDAEGGNDNIYIGTMRGGTVDAGDGNNMITIVNMYNGKVEAGDGDDTFSMTGTISSGEIDTGKGNDTININTVTGGKIDAGEGNDTINITVMNSGEINADDGNDVISVTSLQGGSINAGDGDDFIKLTEATAGSINGGDDFDILVAADTSKIGVSNVELIVTGETNSIHSKSDLAKYGITIDGDNVQLSDDWVSGQDSGGRLIFTNSDAGLTISVDKDNFTSSKSYDENVLRSNVTGINDVTDAADAYNSTMQQVDV